MLLQYNIRLRIVQHTWLLGMSEMIDTWQSQHYMQHSMCNCFVSPWMCGVFTPVIWHGERGWQSGCAMQRHRVAKSSTGRPGASPSNATGWRAARTHSSPPSFIHGPRPQSDANQKAVQAESCQVGGNTAAARSSPHAGSSGRPLQPSEAASAPRHSPKTSSPPCSELDCRHFNVCSGCDVDSNWRLPAQFQEAQQFFEQRRYPGFKLWCGSLHGWRCRAKLAVRGRAGSPEVGLFKQGTHTVVDIVPDCRIHHARINQAAALIKDVSCSTCSNVLRQRALLGKPINAHIPLSACRSWPGCGSHLTTSAQRQAHLGRQIQRWCGKLNTLSALLLKPVHLAYVACSGTCS